MTDEVRRISKLVAEGKLSPEDAAELIDAFYASERVEEAQASGSAEATAETVGTAAKDTLKTILDAVEKLGKEGADAVNWPEVSKNMRSSAKKGFEALRHGLEDIGKGKVNLGWLQIQEAKTVTLPLSVAPGKTLRVENAAGDVRITGGHESGSVVAKASFRGQNREDAKAKADSYTPIIEESDHLVLIRQPDVSGLRVDLEIQMSGIGNVEVKADAGDVWVENTKGACRVTGRSGDISVSGLNGVVEITGESGDVTAKDISTPSLTIENKSGDLTITNVKGNLNIRSATGDVNAKGVAGKAIAVESVSGDVTLDIVEPTSGSVNVRTVSGDANIGITDGSDARISISTLRGSISTEVELKDAHKQEQRITGRLAEGVGTIDVSAVTGDICFGIRDAVAV